jgi:hypothetical protein
VKRFPRRTGYVPAATRDEPCKRVQIQVPTSVRLRLDALEQGRREAGGAEKPDPPSPSQLNKEEREYLACIRRLSYQGETPRPGSVGPKPWYLTLNDATDYLTQRLEMHKQERARLERLQTTGEHVRAPSMAVADCIREGLALGGGDTGDDHFQASIPVSLLRACGLQDGGRDVAGLLAALPSLLAPFGLVYDEVESLRATVAAFDALPPPSRTVVEALSRAAVAGLATVEKQDRERAPRGGLASRLPPADRWTCAGWDNLRAQGREVPPLPWK